MSDAHIEAGGCVFGAWVMDEHSGETILEPDDAVLTVVNLRPFERSTEETVWRNEMVLRDYFPVGSCHCKSAAMRGWLKATSGWYQSGTAREVQTRGCKTY